MNQRMVLQIALEAVGLGGLDVRYSASGRRPKSKLYWFLYKIAGFVPRG